MGQCNILTRGQLLSSPTTSKGLSVIVPKLLDTLED
jgi:hypothetical protein